MAQGDSARVQEAQKLVKEDPRKAEQQLKDIISQPPSVTSEAAIREYETALTALGELYRDEKYVPMPSSRAQSPPLGELLLS
jgi:26S proteasome regulatory subunit N6